jgi:hypothetical protein
MSRTTDERAMNADSKTWHYGDSENMERSPIINSPSSFINSQGPAAIHVLRPKDFVDQHL